MDDEAALNPPPPPCTVVHPPLQLLPVFEATARLGSMSRAAQELNLTPSAVSQQIKQLESVMEVQLFHRLTRRIELTEAGQQFFDVATRTLRAYRQGHADMLGRFSRPVLRISCMPSVAHQLVLPGLASFQEAFPGIDLRLDSRMEVVDFDVERIDAAVRTGPGNWPGLVGLPLAPCHGTLVASPQLLKRQPIETLADLRHHVLIHPRITSGDQDDWDLAAGVMNVPRIQRKGDLMLDSDLAGLQAAEQGLGVTIGFTPGINGWLQAGRLMALVDPIPMAVSHYFVYRESAQRDPVQLQRLQAVYAWIKGLYDAVPPVDPAACRFIKMSG
ncbi:MAG: LysR substrate-binding domain-containing protein [Aquabacterium sp.]